MIFYLYINLKYFSPLLDVYKKSSYYLEFLIFGLSFIICLIPKGIKNINALAVIFPILTICSAGILLAVLLLDIIPHIYFHDNTHKNTDEKNATAGMIAASISFILLTAIDQCVIKHEHCEENEENEHLHCSDVKKDNHHHHSHGTENKVVKDNEGIGCCNTKNLQNTRSKTKALIYIFCISLHSFFEGLAIKKTIKLVHTM